MNISIKTEDGLLLEVRTKEGGRVRLKLGSDLNRAKFCEYCLEFINAHPEFQHFYDQDNPMIRNQLKNAILNEFKTTDHNLVDDALQVAEKVLVRLNKPMISERTDIVSLIPISSDAFRNLLMGRFGVGKSTLIKTLTNFAEDLDFPVTDTARTTTFSTEYIFKDPAKVSKYSFAAEFKSDDELRLKLGEAASRALRKSIQLALRSSAETAEKDTEEEVLKAFISDPERLFKNEYIFGKYLAKHHPKREDESRKSYTDWWVMIYIKIHTMTTLLLQEEGIAASGEKDWNKTEGIEEKLLESIKRPGTQVAHAYEGFVEDILSEIQAKADKFCKELEEEGLGESIRDSSMKVRGFYSEKYNDKDMERILTLFTSTQAKHFGRLLTPVVDRIRIEVPYNEKLPEDVRRKQLVITDTVGIEHTKTTDTRSIEGSTHFLFEQYDAITVVDDASKSMDSTTTNIIRSLFASVSKGKIFISYTFYDKFDKKDFEDEADKDFELYSLQDAAVRKIAEELSYDNAGWLVDDLRNRTTFLKDLIPGTGQIQSVTNFVKSLFKYQEEMNDFKQVQPWDKEKPLLVYNYKKLALVFSQAQQEFLDLQRKIYFQEYLHWKTVEALTWRLSTGSTYFVGSYKILRPIDDFCDILLHKLNHFLANPAKENFFHKNNKIENLSEKVKDWLKELVSDSVKKMSNDQFVHQYKQEWRNAYNEQGYGSDMRRRKRVMDIFGRILPPIQMDAANHADIWIDALETMIEEALERMGSIKRPLEMKRKHGGDPLYRLKRSVELELFESKEVLAADKPLNDCWTFKNEFGEWIEIRFGVLAEMNRIFDIIEEGAAKLDVTTGFSKVLCIYTNPHQVERSYNIRQLGKVSIIIVNEDEIDNFSILKFA